jgi:hypothetical protein
MALGPHVTISASGVVEVIPNGRGKAPPATDFTPLAVWLRELAVFNALRQLRPFVLHRRRKAFRLWRQAVRSVRFEQARTRLVACHFMADMAVAPALVAVWRILHDAYHGNLSFTDTVQEVRCSL